MRALSVADDSCKRVTAALVTLERQGPARKLLAAFAPVCLPGLILPPHSRLLILLPQNCIRHKDPSLGSVWEEAEQATSGGGEWGGWGTTGRGVFNPRLLLKRQFLRFLRSVSGFMAAPAVLFHGLLQYSLAVGSFVKE